MSGKAGAGAGEKKGDHSVESDMEGGKNERKIVKMSKSGLDEAAFFL